VHPGRIPALIHAAYADATDPAQRCRLAAALAAPGCTAATRPRRHVRRGGLALADAVGRPPSPRKPWTPRWSLDGADDFAVRVELAARLDGAAAHLADPAPRLTAHLWRLTTAWECLDVVAVQRQLRALDLLAAETGAARYAVLRRRPAGHARAGHRRP